jgi:hypothetical protein
MTLALSPVSPAFAIVYDLRDTGAWRQAHAHRRLWGRLFSEYYFLDSDHVLIVFMPGGERWRRWEARRKQRILGREAPLAELWTRTYEPQPKVQRFTRRPPV